MQFDDRELQFINDQEFLLTKNTIIGKVQGLLDLTRTEIHSAISNYKLALPEKATFRNGKISRGENYRGLPYLVLDYPAVYSKEDIFAFRTMFWWGNFFSISFLLQGRYFDHYRSILLEHWQRFVDDQLFICINESPWEYHYGDDNYRQLSEGDRALIENLKFLKLSKKIALDQWEKLPLLSSKFVTDFLKILERTRP